MEGMWHRRAKGCSSAGSAEKRVGRVAFVAWRTLIARSEERDPIIYIQCMLLGTKLYAVLSTCFVRFGSIKIPDLPAYLDAPLSMGLGLDW